MKERHQKSAPGAFDVGDRQRLERDRAQENTGRQPYDLRKVQIYPGTGPFRSVKRAHPVDTQPYQIRYGVIEVTIAGQFDWNLL